MTKQVYQIIQFFDKMYYELTDLEKKEFFQAFIESIEYIRSGWKTDAS